MNLSTAIALLSAGVCVVGAVHAAPAAKNLASAVDGRKAVSLLPLHPWRPSSTGDIPRRLQDGTWSQLGGDIDGEAAFDYSGWSVCLSEDGRVIAVGARHNDGNGSGSGHVLVFTFSEGKWSQLGSDIDGEAANDYSGWSVSLSSDGSVLAVGAYYNDGNGSNSGHVRVFKYDNGSNSWNQRGADIDGEADQDKSGYSVSLSSDGNILAIGAHNNDGNGSNSGHVRVFKYDSGSWVQRGTDIDGEANQDQSGYSVSLSSDGNVLAIGAPTNDRNGSDAGHVRVFKYDNGSWVQRGGDIDGEAAYDYSGRSVSLSSDGSVLAIGAPTNDGNGSNSGHVRVFEYEDESWVQRGTDIDGEAADDQSGWSVSLSLDGSVLAIGALYSDGNGSNSGHVRIFKYKDGSWVQRGTDIDGEATNDNSGNSVSLSSDGSFLAIGALYNDGNGANAGHVRVFKFASSEPQVLQPQPSSDPTQAPDATAPWDIAFKFLDADLSSSSVEELEVNYEISKHRSFEAFLYQGNCVENITDIEVNSTNSRLELNATHDSLALLHSIDKSAIRYSSIWNEVNKTMEFCQVVNLILPAGESGGLGKLVIIEDVHQVSVAVDLSANFNATLALKPLDIFNETGNVDVSSYVNAYKCISSNDFGGDDSTLGPNDQAHFCIVSTSADIKVDQLVSMRAIQQNQDGEANLQIIQNGSPFINSITSIQYEEQENGVVVGTRFPKTLFTYATGKSITIQGEIVMMLDGDVAKRKLRALDVADTDGVEKALYELKIDLDDDVAAEDSLVLSNSAAKIALGKVFAMVVLVVAL
eukprot:CAMPEP_0172538436 /NCGR_PEP_ID=MMETSP1067-20121228/9819_1 /TAXON_ID=265564 ORGANISM="Thalassiosira punctigera, Strain Tpunct2005C2" /NCGR_SAMPLE_ID=MMETSP1067 /ASSEMBLY_ACC=CAM_ASM_000444 /LENGTH=807 /DNA_ID=CAMNT_0013323935 /DNA_START=54 /DNA_END=2477 /DNA_ORIENTATION=+